MFEREIKFIYDFNLNKVNKLGPFFTFEQLLASELHPAIIQYISAEIDYLIFEDRQKLLKNSVFDYSGEKISYHFNQISEEVKKTKRFALEYIAKLVLHASSFTVNYLIHPKWTLQKFVFDESQTKTTNEIKQILNYVYYYKYTNRILISYINTKKILSMNSKEFEELLNKADKLGTETYLEAILSNALKSMAEFLNIGEIKKSKIPLSAVEMFLEEKELVSYLQKVSETFGKDENTKIEISDILKVMKNVMIVKEEPLPEIEEVEKFETEEIVTEESKTAEVEEEIDLEEIVEEREQKQDHKTDQGHELASPSRERSGQEQEYEHEQEENETLDEQTDIVEEKLSEEIVGEKEISVPQSAKLRIRMDEDIRIEPVYEEQTVSTTENTLEESDEIEKGIDNATSEENDTDKLNVPEEKYGENLFGKPENPDEENEEQDRLSFIIKQKDEAQFETKNETMNEADLTNNESAVESNDNTDSEKEFEYVNKANEVTTNIQQESDESFKVDLAEVLEHKEMTKIIEVIYDYDIEDFAKTLDEISNCRNADDAHLVINQTLITRRINRNSKEAETFRSIISEYFGGK